ncbi:SusD/RagB family nutrient-binding outer membrane lipoprotein [Flavitalea flava]
MKRINIFSLLLAGFLIAGTGCKKFLDVNKDPNHPLTVSESLVLGPVELTTGTLVVGGFAGTTTAYWMQQLSQNQQAPNVETYLIQAIDPDNTWSFYLYPNIFENLDVMIKEAESQGHHEYVVIGKALFAYNMAITTDLWGSVPFSQALQPTAVPKPKYDSQEDIYKGIQSMLDSALYYISQPASAIAPSTDDFIYGGVMDQWKKFIYTLKARYALRLTKAPGHTAAAQADEALADLANGFGSNADNAAISYPGSAQAENPWYENTLPGAGGVVMAKSFMDSLIFRNDPRLPVIAAKGKNGTYNGRASGADPALSPDPDVFSSINTFYGGYQPTDENNTDGTKAPLFLATYSEALFIKAEATFIKSGAAAAAPIYKAAIVSHMNLLGITNPTVQDNYYNSRPALTDANALQQIISEKYVADFLSLETYNDWRRTGFPVLTKAQNSYNGTDIPRRWPYSFTELLTNAQPEQTGVTLASRVWWDAQ